MIDPHPSTSGAAESSFRPPAAGAPRASSAVAERRVRARIADELAVAPRRVDAAVGLLDGGATVPFIARYRKEATEGLDDTQLRTLDERLVYLRELESRRTAIVASVVGQGKLSASLSKAIDSARTKQELEDLYLPFKPKRRTKAQIAREAGLEPLADALLDDRGLVPHDAASAYVSVERGVPDAKSALDGARDILAERFAERPEVLSAFRDFLWGRPRSCRSAPMHQAVHRARRRKSSVTTSITQSRYGRCRRTVRSRCSEGGSRACCRCRSARSATVRFRTRAS
jgi:transcriptional accessory protein Tex/SPT6